MANHNVAEFIEVDQDWANESTRYWFEHDGEKFAIVESGSDTWIIDCDGAVEQDGPTLRRWRQLASVTDELRALASGLEA